MSAILFLLTLGQDLQSLNQNQKIMKNLIKIAPLVLISSLARPAS